MADGPRAQIQQENLLADQNQLRQTGHNFATITIMRNQLSANYILRRNAWLEKVTLRANRMSDMTLLKCLNPCELKKIVLVLRESREEDPLDPHLPNAHFFGYACLVTQGLLLLGTVLRIRLAKIEGFLQELDDPSQKKAVFLLRLLEQSPLPFLPDPHGEKVEADLYALRVMTKTNPRLYYTVHGGEAVMLTGIYKKKGRIPQQTLEHCRQLIRQLRSHGGHP